MPQITEINEISGCENNALNITISANIQEVRWYDRETDGKMVFEGLSYTTQLVRPPLLVAALS